MAKKKAFDKEYAVYRKDKMVVMGTAYECAEFLNVQPETVYWMSTKTGHRRADSRKDPENAQRAICLD